MDEARVDALLDRLVAWGLVESDEGDVRTSRKWNAKLQATAEKINLIAAKTGAPPAGNPLVVAASQALANENLEMTEAEFDDFVRLLVLLELSRASPAKRASLGFGDVLFPGEKKAESGSAVDF